MPQGERVYPKELKEMVISYDPQIKALADKSYEPEWEVKSIEPEIYFGENYHDFLPQTMERETSIPGPDKIVDLIVETAAEDGFEIDEDEARLFLYIKLNELKDSGAELPREYADFLYDMGKSTQVMRYNELHPKPGMSRWQ